MKDQIRRVIRGEAHWSCLRDMGFEIELHTDQGQRQWKLCHCPDEALLRPEDLLIGIANLRAQPAALSEWASFLWACDGIDWLELEDDSPRNEALKDAIWRLAFGETAEQVMPRLAPFCP